MCLQFLQLLVSSCSSPLMPCLPWVQRTAFNEQRYSETVGTMSRISRTGEVYLLFPFFSRIGYYSFFSVEFLIVFSKSYVIINLINISVYIFI